MLEATADMTEALGGDGGRVYITRDTLPRACAFTVLLVVLILEGR